MDEGIMTTDTTFNDAPRRLVAPLTAKTWLVEFLSRLQGYRGRCAKRIRYPELSKSYMKLLY